MCPHPSFAQFVAPISDEIVVDISTDYESIDISGSVEGNFDQAHCYKVQILIFSVQGERKLGVHNQLVTTKELPGAIERDVEHEEAQ